MKMSWAQIGVCITICVGATTAYGVTPTPKELRRSTDWAAERFDRDPAQLQPAADSPGLVVVANHDPVQHNARSGKPLNLAGQQYTRGLYCHAISQIIVRLPGPGKSFSALAGVDSNADTSGGKGSVVFSVEVAGKEAFNSGVVHENTPAQAVNVDLSGATSFVLKIGDAGVGIASDQSDWADAKVILQDGRELWVGDLPEIAPPPSAYFFSFRYQDRLSDSLLGQWKATRETRILDANRTARTQTWTDPATGLIVRCESIEYKDFPVIEWTLHLKNGGQSDTPIISQIQSIDVALSAADGAAGPILHHSRGSPAGKQDYEPMQTRLDSPSATAHFAGAGGRPTNSDMPYFNVEDGQGAGTIAVIGWPGQWSADFSHGPGRSVRLRGGQELTHLVLHPGEEIRTPLSVLLFYNGDWLRGQNLWRQWMIAHNVPHGNDGKVPTSLLLACSSHQFAEMINANTANQIQFIDGYQSHGIKLDYWWMDAGWYINNGSWVNIGTWEVDQKRFPGGLRAISDHAHEKGVKTIVWFEPERVTAGTWITINHPDWVWGGAAGGLLKIGDPEVRRWLVDHVDKLINTEGIDFYRQDFNMDPLEFWRKADQPDRQGVTEIRHVEGYLAYWDELRARHPGMFIDTCASGGRRNDLETLRRALPLLRSDEIMEPTGQQNHTYGVSLWIPFNGTGMGEDADPYVLRSQMALSNTACWDVRDEKLDYAGIRNLLAERQAIAPLRLGDYYPVSEYSPGNDATIAWQFDRPDHGDGMVQAFRRPDAKADSMLLKLHGLDPAASYRVHDQDETGSTTTTGAQLMEGLTVNFKTKPAAKLIRYERAN